MLGRAQAKHMAFLHRLRAECQQIIDIRYRQALHSVAVDVREFSTVITMQRGGCGGETLSSSGEAAGPPYLNLHENGDGHGSVMQIRKQFMGSAISDSARIVLGV